MALSLLSTLGARIKVNGSRMNSVQSKRTPMRRADRHATRQGRLDASWLMTKLKLFGIPIGLAISSIAPASDTLRTAQSMTA